MAVFLSSYTNAVDKKGRVSVPAPFRAEIATHSRQMIVVYASKKEGCLYAWGYDDFIQFAERIKKLPPMSKQRQRLSRTILAAARPLSFDSDGRTLLPAELLEQANVSEKAVFAGQGEYFTIWSPENYDKQLNEDFDFYDEDMDSLSANWSDL